MVKRFYFRLVNYFVLLNVISLKSYAAISSNAFQELEKINKMGPYMGIVIPNAFEMEPLLRSKSFHPHPYFPFYDFSGRRFRIGEVENQTVIIVMTGLSMLNAGVSTQLLLGLFNVKGVVHYGIAGNANPQLEIGDVTIPQYWTHTGLWLWQRYGDGAEDELPLESNGDYTRKIGYLKLSDYNNHTKPNKSSDNMLNNVWYQPEEIFPINGTPEMRQHAFSVPVDNHYFNVAKKLERMKLERCVNGSCLPRSPMVVRVKRGASANVFVDNAAYRQFLYNKFNVTPIDMESAAIALVCHQQMVPFIAIRSLSDLAGGGSSISNEASIFASLAAENAVQALLRFFQLLS